MTVRDNHRESGWGVSMKKVLHDDLVHQVRKGLRAGEFHIAYQGVYHVSNGILASAEALVRWMHPDHGMLLPGAFIQTVSDPRVAHELTAFVIETVCRQLGLVHREGRAVVPVAINVPPMVLAEDNFAESLERCVRKYDVDLSMIQIELAESEDTMRVLGSRVIARELRRKGISIAVDDFGTGYSSLAMLSAMDIDVVKIAKELIDAVPTCPRACAVASAMLNLLEKLELNVVVEGVETDAQAKWLAQWDNLRIQGFYYSRPAFGLANVPHSKRVPTPHLQLVSGWS